MAKKAKAQGKDLMVLTDRLDRLAVSSSNLKRLALEYISLKEISPEVREVLDTFLFLKDVPKNGAYYDWASRRLNPVLALWKHEGAERPSPETVKRLISWTAEKPWNLGWITDSPDILGAMIGEFPELQGAIIETLGDKFRNPFYERKFLRQDVMDLLDMSGSLSQRHLDSLAECIRDWGEKGRDIAVFVHLAYYRQWNRISPRIRAEIGLTNDEIRRCLENHTLEEDFRTRQLVEKILRGYHLIDDPELRGLICDRFLLKTMDSFNEFSWDSFCLTPAFSVWGEDFPEDILFQIFTKPGKNSFSIGQYLFRNWSLPVEAICGRESFQKMILEWIESVPTEANRKKVMDHITFTGVSLERWVSLVTEKSEFKDDLLGTIARYGETANPDQVRRLTDALKNETNILGLAWTLRETRCRDEYLYTGAMDILKEKSSIWAKNSSFCETVVDLFLNPVISENPKLLEQYIDLVSFPDTDGRAIQYFLDRFSSWNETNPESNSAQVAGKLIAHLEGRESLGLDALYRLVYSRGGTVAAEPWRQKRLDSAVGIINWAYDEKKAFGKLTKLRFPSDSSLGENHLIAIIPFLPPETTSRLMELALGEWGEEKCEYLIIGLEPHNFLACRDVILASGKKFSPAFLDRLLHKFPYAIGEKLFENNGAEVIGIFCGESKKKLGFLMAAAAVNIDAERTVNESLSASVDVDVNIFMSNILSTIKRKRTVRLPSAKAEALLLGALERNLQDRNDEETLGLTKRFLSALCEEILGDGNENVREEADKLLTRIGTMENELEATCCTGFAGMEPVL